MPPSRPRGYGAQRRDARRAGERRPVRGAAARDPAGARLRGPHPAVAWQGTRTTTSGRTRRTRAACGGAPRWRSTAAEPDWEMLLDVDALAAAEGENWVWQGVDRAAPGLRPRAWSACRAAAPTRAWCASSTSSDAGVRRRTASRCPRRRATSAGSTRDTRLRRHRLRAGLADHSGYPRIVKEWRRGTPLAAAQHASSRARPTTVGAARAHDPTPGFERDLVRRRSTSSTARHLPAAGDELIRLDVPDDAAIDAAPRVAADPAAHAGGSAARPGRRAARPPTSTPSSPGEREFTVLFAARADARRSTVTRSGLGDHLLLALSSTCSEPAGGGDARRRGRRRAAIGGDLSSASPTIVDTDPDDVATSTSADSSGFSSRRRCARQRRRA